jgi:5-hydroxyisourate hydrolase-like protein (transthyretin family)
MATAIALRRRLAACRPVTDAALLWLLESCRRKMRLKRTPALLVTPQCVSPCIWGTFRARIVLPESVVTESSIARLGHVLAHELAHLVRGDLWTNWLLVAARILHWFNPVAWWTVREMQAEREAACDELACAALGESERSAYAATIVELASLPRSAIAPGLIGLFTPTCRVKSRVQRLLRSPTTNRLPALIAAAVLLAIACAGLTDAMPVAKAQPPNEPAAVDKQAADADSYTFAGRCVEDADGSPLAGISVRLYRVEGRTSAPVEIARTVTDADGRYAFTGLEPPRPYDHLDRLDYGIFGFAEGRPIGIPFFHFRGQERVFELRMSREGRALSGTVVDADGRPVAGATVTPYFVFDRAVPELLAATTDDEGRFQLENVGAFKWQGGEAVATGFGIQHPDFVEAMGTADGLPAKVSVSLESGCVVTGTVVDEISGKPAARVTITARRVDEWKESFFGADADGQFRMVVPEGRYDFLAEARDRVAIAVTGRECLAGQKVELPPFTLVEGGFIAGQVVNTRTGRPVAKTERGQRVMLGLFGPSQPPGPVISPKPLATVDKAGRFILRAAAGENFPYLVNERGVRMAWDTREQPPVVVKDGETTTYDMLISPPIPADVALEAAQKLVAAMPEEPSQRTEQILAEFRKLNDTVDETELWCLLMRELVTIGPDAVPWLCAELDRTTENRMLRRLGFALRAIGDARAVPALIRAIPKTLLPSGSDYGLLVSDKGLTDFMQAHDLDQGKRANYFSLGRPVREIFGALNVLTGHQLDDAELLGMSLSEDPRRQVLQRRIYGRQAQRWQAWWEANAARFTGDSAYHKIDLNVIDEPLPPAPRVLGTSARLVGEWTGAVLSPATEESEHAWRAYDLDTACRPQWPAAIAKDEAARDEKQLADWAAESGVDLICVTQRAPNGTETFVLRALGMQVREIDARDLRNLDSLVTAGTLPEGRPAGELLMHFDAASQQFAPDANAAFLFVTREGSMGLIETTDRVTRTADLTGLPSAPPGTGFHKGVRFNLKAIIP